MANELGVGESLAYMTPVGAKVVMTRQQVGDRATDFIALSSICPHLGWILLITVHIIFIRLHGVTELREGASRRISRATSTSFPIICSPS